MGKYYLAGDSAHRDIDGYIWIMGRIDDVLNVSGHRLGTMEIESALVANSKVAEAAVVGRPDAIKGESVVAFVVLKGARPTGAEGKALISELREIGWPKRLVPLLNLMIFVLVITCQKRVRAKLCVVCCVGCQR
jgi:acyl-coenzyme A synthetase/AMP-(fatty) acid ligase